MRLGRGFGRVGAAILEVHVHGQAVAAAIARQLSRISPRLAVLRPSMLASAEARGRERLEAERGEQPSGAGVPRIGDDEGARPLVKRPKRRRLLGLCAHGWPPLWSDNVRSGAHRSLPRNPICPMHNIRLTSISSVDSHDRHGHRRDPDLRVHRPARRLHRAAGQLNRSQPAISRRIGLIEQDLGAPVRTRARRREADRSRPRASCRSPRQCWPRSRTAASGARHRQRGARRGVARAGGYARRYAHRRGAAAVRARSRSVNLELRTAIEPGGQRPGAARRGHLGAALFRRPPSRPDFTGRRRRNPAGDLRGGSSARRQAHHDGTAAAGERWIAFPAVRGRKSFGGCSSGSSPSPASTARRITLIDSLTAQKRLVEAGFGIALVPESSVRDEIRLGP